MNILSLKKITLKWKDEEYPYTVEVSENANFIEAQTFSCSTNSCNLENLKIGWTYYWRVNGGEVHSFGTENNGTRFMRVDGLRNVRDLGGRKIKQSLIYRGSEMEGNNYRIIEEGKRVVTEVMKIKTELDLRREFYAEGMMSPVEGVVMKQIPYRPYMEVFEDQHKQALLEIMEFLSDENNYPIYFHCMGGADRTGMIAMYLQALVGESEEDIFLDYELTSLSRIPMLDSTTVEGYRSRNYDYFTEFLDELKKYAPNESLQSQIKAFLMECGVTEECMKKIINILKI